MKTLSGLDATFLYLETPEMPMHVGSLNLYALPKGFKGSFHKAVVQHLAGRIHLAPIFTRKLLTMPLNLGHPGWVEADETNLASHVHKEPGRQLSITQLHERVAKLHGELLDRDRPLWSFHVFDSVKAPDGNRLVALYSKIHHATLDGKSGAVLANAILDVTPVPREVPPPDARRRVRHERDVGAAEQIGALFSGSLAQYVKLAKALPGAVSSLGGALAKQSGLTGDGTASDKSRAKAPLTLAPHTPFNAAITDKRSFATASLPFAACQAVGKTLGASFNDIVLWLCSTALRSYLAQHASIPDKSLVAAMPVSLRDEGNTDMTTQASMTVVQLGTHLADPAKRLKAIMASTGKVKSALVGLKSVLPTDYPSLLAPWLVGGVAKAAFKTYSATSLPEHLPMLANLVISNVPGPKVPLYLAGARMVTYHPLSIITHGLALNITVQTYAGSVDFGLVADKEAVPHLQDLAAALESAFLAAQALVPEPTPEPAIVTSGKTRGKTARPPPKPAGAKPARKTTRA